MRSLTLFFLASAICAVMIPMQVSAGGKGKKGWGGMKKCGEGEINKEEAFKGFKECKAANPPPQEDQPKEETESTERRRRSPHEGGGEGGKRKGRKGGWGKMMKNTCMMVCQWKVVGVISNETSTFDEPGCKDYVDRVYPEDKRADMLEKMKHCNEENSKDFSMDDNCKGFGGFKRCIMKAHGEVCGWKKGGGKQDGQGPPPPPPESEDE